MNAWDAAGYRPITYARRGFTEGENKLAAVGSESQDREKLLHRIGSVAASAGGGTPERPRVRTALRLGLAALVLAFLVVAVASQWDELKEQDVEFNPIWLLPALVMIAIPYAMAAFGWDLVLRALGHWLRPLRAQAIWAQSLMARYVPGTLLLVVGRVLLSEREGVPRRTTMASLIYEQGVFLVSALIVGSWLLLGAEKLGGEAERIAVLALAPLLVIVLHPRIFGPLSNRALTALGREPLQRLLPMRHVLMLTAYFLFVWVVLGVGAFFAARTVFDLSFSELPAVAAANALGYGAAVLTVVFPGGLGVRDGAFALALDSALPGGFALAAAVAIAVRLMTIVAEILYAVAANLLGRRLAPASAGQPLRDAT